MASHAFTFDFKAESVSDMVLMYDHIHRKLCPQGLWTHLRSNTSFDVIQVAFSCDAYMTTPNELELFFCFFSLLLLSVSSPVKTYLYPHVYVAGKNLRWLTFFLVFFLDKSKNNCTDTGSVTHKYSVTEETSQAIHSSLLWINKTSRTKSSPASCLLFMMLQCSVISSLLPPALNLSKLDT